MEHFRIHGDNIVECERIYEYLKRGINIKDEKYYFSSLSCLNVELKFEYEDRSYFWKLELFPGFGKNGSERRWDKNIFSSIKRSGSFLGENPDAIITKVENDVENILLAVEFCSALQAGNQAWQRSGRAYSVGRSGCPYLYIVDFVKYELNSENRERKALRFPNPIVPYSYINYSNNNDVFTIQAYVRSEEFDHTDERLLDFDDDIFSEKEITLFILKTMMNMDTTDIKESFLCKSLKMIKFLSRNNENSKKMFLMNDWEQIYNKSNHIFEYSLANSCFSCSKTIQSKSAVGNNLKFVKLIKEKSSGVSTEDMPFGVISGDKKEGLVKQLKKIYSNLPGDIFDKIKQTNKNLVICMIKGFKPGGDDNRPDRGILPLIVMSGGEETEILTYIYGPIVKSNYDKLCNDKEELFNGNGLWKAILSLSDFVFLDAPVLCKKSYITQELLDNRAFKKRCLDRNSVIDLSGDVISNIPAEYHEDDVDTVLHMIFKHYMKDNCFEGMCNPPGGDWSGLSIIKDEIEYKWISLPRVSYNSKRPDHVTELMNIFEKPVLLITESKEKKRSLENNIGVELKNYIKWLMKFTPSVEKRIGSVEWNKSNQMLNYDDYIVLSAGAYIVDKQDDNYDEFDRTKCDIIFELCPIENEYWSLKIYANTGNGEIVRKYLIEYLKEEKDQIIKVE